MTEVPTARIEEWISRLNAGDVKAREELLNHTYQRLLKIAHNMLLSDFPRLSSDVQTDDVVQELYLRLLKKQDYFLPAGGEYQIKNGGHYFARSSELMRQVLLDQVRKVNGRAGNRPRPMSFQGASANADGEKADHDPSTSTHDPERVAYWTAFHEAVATLPPLLREVIDLRWYNGLSVEEAAAVLGIAAATIRKRWAQARLLLQDQLEKCPLA